jgi:hypothetical protein
LTPQWAAYEGGQVRIYCGVVLVWASADDAALWRVLMACSLGEVTFEGAGQSVRFAGGARAAVVGCVAQALAATD